MKNKILVLFPLLLLLAGGLFAFQLYRTPVTLHHDVTAFNRIAGESARHWDNLSLAVWEEIPYPFSVLTADGTVRYLTGADAVTSVYQAAAEGYPILDVRDEERIIGKVIITAGAARMLTSYKKRTALFILAACILAALSMLLHYLYLRSSVIKPFSELKEFASQVSRGNLNLPLQIRKDNIFGAFTESFDILREQLKLSRQKEIQASIKQKELVASLSHDIKTPLTSIKLTGELLLELEKEERLKTKIGMINEKTGQIEELVTNLFHTTLQDMEQLTVSPVPVYSSALEGMLKSADFEGRVRLTPVPDCLLLLDELRFTQVLSNIISNSYKYAGTDIEVSASLMDSHLKLSLFDRGPGAPEEELPLLFNKFYRGSNASGQSGSGLGLYICKKLVEQMQGDIYCACRKDGFQVILMVKLYT